MSEYIPLKTFTPSSSEESLFNRPSTSGIRQRGGYTAIPIHSSTSTISSVGSDSKFKAPRVSGVLGATVGAGSQYQNIFEGQLGAAAADPNNPLKKWFHSLSQVDPKKVKYEQESAELLRRNKISAGYKPYEVPWNKNSKSQWREHWSLVNPRAGQKKIKEKQQKKNRNQAVLSRGEPPRNGLVLPFSNNIGPGNPIRPPTNTADLIAQGHDIHYQQAKKDSDVLSADREAISQFAHEAIQGSDPISRLHATVGGLGLGIKHGVEKLTGKVFYGSPQEAEQSTHSEPEEEDGIDNFLNQVRDNQQNRDMSAMEVSSSQSAVKRPASDTGKAGGKKPKEGGKSSLPGTSNNTDGDSGNEPAGHAILRPIGINNEVMIKTYYKKHRFLTSANANVILQEKATGTKPARFSLTTGLASIPWEYLFMYMTPAEYNRMKSYPGTHAVSAHITVRAWNTRVAFQTAETTSTNATLNQNKFLQVAKGIRSIPFITSDNRRYTYSKTEPMEPNGFETDNSATYREGLKTAMYGYDNNSTSFKSAPPSNATGAEIYLRDYLTVYTLDATETPNPAVLPGFPPYKDFLEEFDASACVNGIVAVMDYDFNYAPLSPNFASVPYNMLVDTGKKSFSAGTKQEVGSTKIVDCSETDSPQQLFNGDRKFLQGPHADTTYFTEEQNYYKRPLEQGGCFEEINRETIIDSQQPSLHVGIRAVPKLTTSSLTTQAKSWLDAQGYFEVECTLVTKSVDPYTYIKQGCFANPANTQLQWYNATAKRHVAKNYDSPNVYGRMTLSNTE